MENTIQVSIDKSHITTIGEKLYGESLELIRELVSNAYDADASRVWIELETDELKVKDDGTGMNEAGLREYFNIGSQNKKFSNISGKYRRQKIGQFGIGKFAVLTACNLFHIYTQKDGYAAEVIFDKTAWGNNDQWSLPIRKCEYIPMMGNGTIITLQRLTKSFTLPEIERFIRERLPLNAPHFEAYLNKKKIEPVYISGRHFPISTKTNYGVIQGEIIAPNFTQKIQSNKAGIEITVNGIMVRRETFEMETDSIFLLHKLIGRVAADFLQITSDRNRFITDATEYQEFFTLMRKEIKKIAVILKTYSNLKAKEKADETLKEAMTRLGRAIRKNPVFSPKILAPTGEIDETGENPNSFAPETIGEDSEGIEALKLSLNNIKKSEDDQDKKFEFQEKEKNLNKVKKVKIKNLTGKMMVARRIKIGGLGIVCNIDSYGKDEKPVFVEGGIIYINQDHLLYQKQAKLGKDNLGFYLGYLLSQQIALMVAESDPYKAFAIQNKLLSDSF